jgi:uncharacterized membrane protein YciS (DUF1049 family)
MIPTIQSLVGEISNLWWYAYGIIAGWGLSFTVVVTVLVWTQMKIAKLENDIKRYHNQMVSEARESSLRLNKLEK